jgi:hypothetical protein
MDQTTGLADAGRHSSGDRSADDRGSRGNDNGSGETEMERWQRNYAELLQELRVAQAGVQILFAFLLTIAFSERFAGVDSHAKTVYLVALLSAVASAALMIAPVAQHRALFRMGEKPHITRTSHRLASGGLALMSVSMVAAVQLATDTVLERPAAWVVAIAAGAWFALWWAVFPQLRRLRLERAERG